MQNVWSNTQFNTQSFNQNENHNWASSSFQTGPFTTNNNFYDSGPTSLPCFQNSMKVDNAPNCSWFEITNKKCFPKAGSGANQHSGASSLTMFGQSMNSLKRRDSTASSKQGSLGSQEWGEMVDEVILDEMNEFKENIGSLSNKISVF